MGARVVLAGLADLIAFVVAYGLFMSAVPPDPTAASSPIPSAVAPLVVAALQTAVMGWLILRSRLTGWTLALTMIAVFYGVQSFQPQVESWIFQAYAGSPRRDGVVELPVRRPRGPAVSRRLRTAG